MSALRSPALRTLVAAILAGLLVGCGAVEKPRRPAEEVLAEHNPVLLETPGVIGTGVTDWQDREVILILVERKDDPRIANLPERLEGHPIFVVDKAQVEAWTGLEMP